jgi:hypothetical protein
MMHGTVLVSCITRALYRVCGSMIHSACGLSADDLCCCCCCEATVCDHQDHQPIGSRSTGLAGYGRYAQEMIDATCA